MREMDLLDAPLADAGAAVAQANAKEEEFLHFAQESIDSTVELASAFRKVWEGFRRVVQGGEVEAVRVVLGTFLVGLEKCLGFARSANLQAQKAETLRGKSLPRADRLAAGLSELEALQREAIAEWQLPVPEPLEWALLRLDEHADIYVGRSRVLLETIVAEYEAGASPQDIIRGHDTVRPADVHGAIAYYLRYRPVVEAYLRRREMEAEKLREKTEAAQSPRAELKAQMKERWAKRKSVNAAPAE